MAGFTVIPPNLAFPRYSEYQGLSSSQGQQSTPMQQDSANNSKNNSRRPSMAGSDIDMSDHFQTGDLDSLSENVARSLLIRSCETTPNGPKSMSTESSPEKLKLSPRITSVQGKNLSHLFASIGAGDPFQGAYDSRSAPQSTSSMDTSVENEPMNADQSMGSDNEPLSGYVSDEEDNENDVDMTEMRLFNSSRDEKAKREPLASPTIFESLGELNSSNAGAAPVPALVRSKTISDFFGLKNVAKIDRRRGSFDFSRLQILTRSSEHRILNQAAARAPFMEPPGKNIDLAVQNQNGPQPFTNPNPRSAQKKRKADAAKMEIAPQHTREPKKARISPVNATAQ